MSLKILRPFPDYPSIEKNIKFTYLGYPMWKMCTHCWKMMVMWIWSKGNMGLDSGKGSDNLTAFSRSKKTCFFIIKKEESTRLTVNAMSFKLQTFKSNSFLLSFFYPFFLLFLFWLSHQHQQQDSKSSYSISTFSGAQSTIMFYLCHSCGQYDRLEYYKDRSSLKSGLLVDKGKKKCYKKRQPLLSKSYFCSQSK